MFGAANASCVMDYKYTDNKISGMKYCDILSDQECVGVQSTNYVYILDEGMWVWLQLCELTRESLGELDKAVEKLASHSISCSPKLSLVFINQWNRSISIYQNSA